MPPVFDIIALVFVLSCAYLLFRAGVFAAFGSVVTALMVMQLIHLLSKQPGVGKYPMFFAGTVIISAAIVGLFVVHFNLLVKFDIIKWTNRVFGMVAGFLFGLLFISAVMLPVSFNLSEEFGNSVASSYTVSYVIPWVQEIFPETQAAVITRVNKAMAKPVAFMKKKESPAPAAVPGQEKKQGEAPAAPAAAPEAEPAQQ